MRLAIMNGMMAPGGAPAGLTWDGTHVWVADYVAGHIYRLDKDSGEVVEKVWCPGVLSGLTWNGRWLWQALLEEGWVRVIDRTSHDFERTLVVEKPGRVGDLTWDGEYLWVVSQELGLVRAIDPETERVKREVRVPVAAGGVAFREGALWLAYPGTMTFGADGFDWVGDERRFWVGQFDVRSGRELVRYEVDFLAIGLAWVGDVLWLSGGGRLWRARPGG